MTHCTLFCHVRICLWEFCKMIVIVSCWLPCLHHLVHKFLKFKFVDVTPPPPLLFSLVLHCKFFFSYCFGAL
jgi:hypothetical protein